jgi:hypothetical protein
MADVEEGIQWFEEEGSNVSMFNAADPGSIGVTDNHEAHSSTDQIPCDSKSPTGNRKIQGPIWTPAYAQ